MITVLSPANSTSCLAEQAWNDAQLDQPVEQPVVQLWRYEQPGVVLGRKQYALVRSEIPSGLEGMVVRGAGGGAVLTGPWMLSTSILLPPDHHLLGTSIVSSYRWFGSLHAGILRDLGIDAHALSPEAIKQQEAIGCVPWACFGELSSWEVVVNGRKIVGLAQVRRKNGVLLTSGTLVSTPPWEQLCTALGHHTWDAQELTRITTSCEEELGRAVLIETLAERLALGLQDLIGPF